MAAVQAPRRARLASLVLVGVLATTLPAQPVGRAEGRTAVCRAAVGSRAAELVWGQRVLFRLRAQPGHQDPLVRCHRVRERLHRALAGAGDPRIRPGVLHGRAVVLARDRLLVTVLPAEARANRIPEALLAWGWANRLRAALGQRPLGLEAVPYRGLASVRRAVASWYGYESGGRRTASGEPFNPRGRTAAHRTLPFGTVLRVIYPGTGRQVLVRVNDRGPYVRGRDIDLSYGAARAIGMVEAGVARVYVEVVSTPRRRPR